MEKKYLLLGLGVANIALKKYFDLKKINYNIYDDYIFEYKKIDLDYNSFDYIIKSPGIKDNHFIIKNGHTLEKTIISDLEFFYTHTKPKKIITVTGSNGKTTTVSLIHHLLEEIDMGGNIGIALGNFIESSKDIVIEASSFMLDYTYLNHSNINVYTNIYINHLDHHNSLKSYIKAKLKLIKNIKKDDYLIYNYDDQLLRRLFVGLDVQKIPFSIKNKIGLYLIDNDVFFNNQFIFNIDDVKLAGVHNKYNILACIAVLLAYDKNKICYLERLNTFKTLSHRIEYIGRLGNVRVYNDSKSTNFNALKSSLNAFKEHNILLICGGKIKDDDYDCIVSELNQVTFIMINGENKKTLESFFKSNNKDYIVLDNLISVITLLGNYLENVDIILFSPGSSSYDQFNNFEERGNFFKQKMKEMYELIV